mmetsp:Transcript_17139/g.25366  ORF Transcript_17139/g.25366 Transcript_17139/m.25366 type:complete len:277 (+) Transcript_17139:96-926(+)|eukprot:CAMPEP_0171453326 /NCGR_PEP_ID=MMETSP0945-20130129/1080_1 /TAXON_ID=109269 /ORGANISM="Vaucheria litorea, Strain CCMP2940" /LENGTH=276 /DNA_ID=CAMNT_0011978173 /DNA_START=28 /DNA_END=858 /DNA_ORIENTATION=-
MRECIDKKLIVPKSIEFDPCLSDNSYSSIFSVGRSQPLKWKYYAPNIAISHSGATFKTKVINSFDAAYFSPAVVSKKRKCKGDAIIFKSPLDPTESSNDTALTPQQFLVETLKKKGYPVSTTNTLDSKYSLKPTQAQIDAYTLDMVNAVRNNDIEKVKKFHTDGIMINASNKFGESIVHMAARVGAFEILEFMIEVNGPSTVGMSDDYGRTPLHDACWTSEPFFDIVSLLLKHDSSILFLADRRGFTPLAYVKRNHWLKYIQFIESIADEHWPDKL